MVTRIRSDLMEEAWLRQLSSELVARFHGEAARNYLSAIATMSPPPAGIVPNWHVRNWNKQVSNWCQVEFGQRERADTVPGGKPAVAKCDDCGISICSDYREECCGDSFDGYYHVSHSCVEKRLKIAQIPANGSADCTFCNTTSRVRLKALFKDSLGIEVTSGFSSHPSPMGISRVRERASHRRYTPPSFSWNLQ